MSVRRLRRVLLCLVGLYAVHLYLKGKFDEWIAKPFDQFQYPLEIDLPHVVKDLRENKSVLYRPITELPFNFITHRKCKHNTQLVVVVKSAITNGYNRAVIRETWGNTSNLNAPIDVLFHVGSSTINTINKEILMEQEKYNDIIQSDFVDAYHNNTFKSIMGLRWGHTYCKAAKFILYVDDDYYVSLNNLIGFIKLLDHTDTNFWMGYLCLNGEPDRRHWFYAGKWQVGLWKYPYRYWPPFMNGGSYLLSSDLVTDFYLASRFTEFIALDDVFLGIIARKLGIQGRSNETLFPNPGVPRLLISKDDPKLKYVIANHRFGLINDVHYIWKKFQGH